tara:strand:+ start:100 stop:678 length:579 start_codon:yes stop_codon:yes gene_type:complete
MTKVFFIGGPGGNGRSGQVGSTGRTGAAGGRGGYLKSDGTIVVPSTGHDAKANYTRSFSGGVMGVNPYGHPSMNTYNGTCNGGFGGQGGSSGGTGTGGGYAAGGDGGAAAVDTSSAGNVGGAGSDGLVGGDMMGDRAGQPGWDNNCGFGGKTDGGTSCSATSGGTGGAGGTGGNAGSIHVKATGITVTVTSG